MQIDLEKVERLVVKPGETLVLTLAREVPAAVAARIQDQLSGLVPQGVRVMLLGPGMKLQVVAKEAA